MWTGPENAFTFAPYINRKEHETENKSTFPKSSFPLFHFIIKCKIKQESFQRSETGPTKMSETLHKKASPVSKKSGDLKVRCPKCHKDLEPQLLSVDLKSDRLNSYGRRELNYVAQSKDLLQWLPLEKKFRCLICREKFTLKELAVQ